jgi:hypothetical protein
MNNYDPSSITLVAPRHRIAFYLTTEALTMLNKLLTQHPISPPAPPPPSISQLRAERKALLLSRKAWRYTSYGHEWTQDHPDGVRAREAIAATMKPGDLYPQAQLDDALQAWIRGDDLPPLPDGRYTRNAAKLGRLAPATYVAGDILEQLMRDKLHPAPPPPKAEEYRPTKAVSKR